MYECYYKNILTKRFIKMIFRYPGGKFRLSKQIIKYFPDFEEYREPFCGGGSIFFTIPTDKRFR
jgi:site-specific DNA-adenine methylase